MSSEERVTKLLNRVVQELQKVNSIKQIRLFGSQVLRRSNDSDVDILFICSSKDDYKTIIEKIVAIGTEERLLIHPVIYDIPINKLEENSFIRQNMLEQSKILLSR